MKTFVILGMHRSATSLVAEGICDLIDSGNNLSGHYENQHIKKANQQLLSSAGGRWDVPPPEDKILQLNANATIEEALDRAFDGHLKKATENYLWGWKDPRTTLTIRLWLPYLENPHFICCYREPLEVAKSLKKRNGFTIEKGLRLAKIYNNRIKSFMDDWLKYEYA